MGFVSFRYLYHQLLEGTCNLRSSKGKKVRPIKKAKGSNGRFQDNGVGQSPQRTSTKLRSLMA